MGNLPEVVSREEWLAPAWIGGPAMRVPDRYDT